MNILEDLPQTFEPLPENSKASWGVPKLFQTFFEDRANLARIGLIALATSAMVGVWQFANLFHGPIWATVQAGAFELVYIGLALMPLQTDEDRKRAKRISWGAVAVSILYNIITAFFNIYPQFVETHLTPASMLMLSILQGVPLAWVAFLMADLIFHAGENPLKPLVEALNEQIKKGNQYTRELWGELQQAKKEISIHLKELDELSSKLSNLSINYKAFEDRALKTQKDFEGTLEVLGKTQATVQTLQAEKRGLAEKLENSQKEIVRLTGKIREAPESFQISPETIENILELGKLLQGGRIGIKEYRSKVKELFSYEPETSK